MSAAYNTSETADELFREADEKYAALKEKLASAELDSTHSDVEQQLETEGRELLRLLYQSHLTLRSQAEPTVGRACRPSSSASCAR